MKTQNYHQARDAMARVARFFGFLFKGISKDEDARRREHILLIILVVSLMASAILSIFVFYFDYIRGTQKADSIGFPFFACIPLAFTLLIIITKRGMSHWVSSLLAGIYILGALATSYLWGFDLPASMLLDVLAIVISSALLGTRFGLYATCIIGLGNIIIGTLQIQGILHYSSNWRNVSPTPDDPFEYTIFLCIAMILSWLSNREIERALKKARASEIALAKERDDLEITVAKRTEELRIAHLRELNQSRAFIEFGKQASGVFHDIISPLNALHLYIEKACLIDKQIHNKDAGTIELHDAMRCIDKAKNTSQRMKELLCCARSSVRFNETSSTFSLSEIVATIIRLHTHHARKEEITFDIDIPNTLLLFGPRAVLEQAICTIIDNALDALKGAIETCEKKIISVTTDITDQNILISITDTGPGIIKSLLPGLFQPFHSTKGESGTGIGLYLAKESLKHYFNGTISYSEALPHGSIFTISLPKDIILTPQ